MAAELKRTYRSNRIIATDTGAVFAEPMDSPLGYGWTSPFFVQIINSDTFIDADGRYFTFKKDANGNFLTDTSNGMTLKKTTAGFTLTKLDTFTRTFDINGRLLTKSDNFGNSWIMAYDTEGRLTNVKDNINRALLTFTYDTNNHIITAADIAGRTISYEYDTFGSLIKATDAGGSIYTYTYNSYHGITSKTNPLMDRISI